MSGGGIYGIGLCLNRCFMLLSSLVFYKKGWYIKADL